MVKPQYNALIVFLLSILPLNNLRLILLLIPLVILGPLAVDIFLPALPTMAKGLDVSPTLMQWTITVYMFSLGVGQLIFGPLSDKLGRKPIFMFGLLLYVVTAVFIVYAGDYVIHIVLRAIQGIASCAIMVASFASVADKNDASESSKVYSYLNGVIFCIPALAPVLGHYLTITYGWQSNFVFMAVLAVPTILMTAVLFEETKEQNTRPANFPRMVDFRQVLSLPMFMLHAGIVMLAMAVIMAFVSTAPNVFVEQYGLSEASFTLWFSINASVTIVMSFVTAKLLSHFKVDTIIYAGMAIVIVSGLMVLLLTSNENILTYMLPIIVGTAGVAILLGASIGKALAPFSKNIGLATAIIGCIQMSGASCIVTLVQYLGMAPVTQVIVFSLCFVPLYLAKAKMQARNEQELTEVPAR